ncbi:MAG: methyl-accepting chemotaxis protein, partial [Cyanobacteria bacterium J06632_3]
TSWAQARAELRSALALFKSSHEGLKVGDASLALTGNNSATVDVMFEELEPTYAQMVTGSERLLDPFHRSTANAAESIARAEVVFLEEMNAIVDQYEKEATQRVQRLQSIQKGLLALLLMALLPVLFPIWQITRKVNALILTMQRAGIQVKSSSLQIAASGKQLEAAVTEQAAAGSQITASSEEISTVANTLRDHVRCVLDQADAAKSVASMGEAKLSEISTTMDVLTTMTTSIDSRLRTISDRANTIDQVVVAINKVADQTNLLSLNAAIEAEKAGEYGVGFGVVAREIRRLSDQSAIATLEIEKVVKEMQSSVAVGVMEMDKFIQHVSDNTGRTNRVSHQVMQISQQVQSLVPSLQKVDDAIAFQAANVDQIREALASLSVGSQQTMRSVQASNHELARLQATAEGLQL